MKIAILHNEGPQTNASLSDIAAAAQALGHEAAVYAEGAEGPAYRADLWIVSKYRAAARVREARERGIRVVAWELDLVDIAHRRDLLLPTWRTCETVWLKQHSVIAELRHLGIDARWIDQGVPEWCTPRPPEPVYDVGFFGSYRPGSDRIALLQALRSVGLSVAIWSREIDWIRHGYTAVFPWVTGDAFCRAASHCRMIAGCSYTHVSRGAWSNRIWMALGCRRPYCQITDAGLEEVVGAPGDAIDFCSQPERLAWRCRRFIDDPREAEAMAERGHDWAMAHHRLRHRVAHILESICAS